MPAVHFPGFARFGGIVALHPTLPHACRGRAQHRYDQRWHLLVWRRLPILTLYPKRACAQHGCQVDIPLFFPQFARPSTVRGRPFTRYVPGGLPGITPARWHLLRAIALPGLIYAQQFGRFTTGRWTSPRLLFHCFYLLRSFCPWTQPTVAI